MTAAWTEPPEPRQIADLRAALARYDDWPTSDPRADMVPVLDAARAVLATWDEGVRARAELIRHQITREQLAMVAAVAANPDKTVIVASYGADRGHSDHDR